MTARANSVTDRDTPSVRGALHAWDMPAGDVRAFMAGLASLGYDAGSLLGSVGLSDSRLADPDARIPCETMGMILSGAQQAKFTPNLGLRLAEVTPIGAYPLLDYVVLTSDTVGAGIHGLARYSRLVGNPVSIEVHEDCDPIRVDLAEGAAPFGVEFVTSLMLLHLKVETNGAFECSRVTFRHRPDDVGEFQRTFGCSIAAMASSNSISISRGAWRLRLRRGDAVLHRMLEAQANEVLARRPARDSLASEVQRALMKSLVRGDARMNDVARQFALSSRTLQRRLACEGASYRQLLEDARKDAAGRYVRDPTLAIGEIAFLLGYSEPGPFHRAFRRWYGMTPETFRRRTKQQSRLPRTT
jgi:AraC-like DNA-binding protein